MDIDHGTDVETAGRLIGENDPRRLLEDAGENELLDVATGQLELL